MGRDSIGNGRKRAIDFSMAIDRKAYPNGDRVVVILNGMFLPYKVFQPVCRVQRFRHTERTEAVRQGKDHNRHQAKWSDGS